ncbi:MAG: Gfo/Idh/MocA family oxidoreductase [Puniceicoccales bacterium]|jgi:predicted dehydrogenase|nr:Gfo/Idh/MocA family oxidoreductase [Puniceicoccales bacterium]
MSSNASPTVGKVSRRDFLKHTSMALAAGVVFPSLIPASALGRDGTTAPSNRIALGVVGLIQGWDGFDKCLNAQGVEGVGVCDVNAERLNGRLSETRRRANGKSAKGYRDFRDMFANAKLDAVVLGAPDHWHGIMAVAAARAGLDIYGEKPLAHTLAEGRAIVDAVKRHGRIWQTGSWQRSGDKFRKAVNIVRNGLIGKLVRVEAGTLGAFTRASSQPASFDKPPAHIDYDMWVGPAQWLPYDTRIVDFNWRWNLNFGGGNLMDWVGHHVDIAHWGMDKDHTGPVSVRPVYAKWATDYPYNAQRSYTYECTYADGLVMKVTSNSGTKFIGEKGWVFVDRNRLDASSKSLLSFEPGTSDYRAYNSRGHWNNFIDCVKTRKETITPAETAHRSASVGHLGHIALTTGRTIHWDPETETIKDDPGASEMLKPIYRSPWVL